MTNMFDDLYGSPEQEQFVDGFDLAADDRGPFQPLWLSGWKVNIINRKLWKEEQISRPIKGEIAAGWFYEIKKMPADLKDAFQLLVSEGKARMVLIEHQGKDRNKKEYYQLLGESQRYYALMHSVPTRGAIFYKPEHQLGLASGSLLDYDEEKRQYSLYSFLSFLAVNQALYEAGWVDEQGRPKPVILRFKGRSSDELYDAIVPHYNFLKNAREAGLNARKAQVWAYALDLRVSTETKSHGRDGDTTDVFTVENNTWTLAVEGAKTVKNPPYNEQIAEELYCGDDLYKLLFQLVYDTEVRPPRPGGMAVEWCKNVVARAQANQKEWNPGNKLRFGSRQEAPAWMVTKKQKEEATRSFGGSFAQSREDEEQPAQRSAPKASDPYQELRDRFTPALMSYRKQFVKAQDKDALDLVKKGLMLLKNESGQMEPFEIEVEVEDLINDTIKPAVKRIQRGDEYEV